MAIVVEIFPAVGDTLEPVEAAARPSTTTEPPENSLQQIKLKLTLEFQLTAGARLPELGKLVIGAI